MDYPLITRCLGRLAKDPQFLLKLEAHPLLFASWYALVAPSLDPLLPDRARSIVTAERTRKLSLERTLSLLAKIDGSIARPGEKQHLAHARQLLVGYALHDWVASYPDDHQKALHTLGLFFEHYAEGTAHKSMFSHKLDSLVRCLGLTGLEADVLSLAASSAMSQELRQFLTQLLAIDKANVARTWTVIFGCDPDALYLSVSPQAPLRVSRILQLRDSTGIPLLSEFWLDLLLSSSESLLDMLAKPMSVGAGSGVPARIADEDASLAAALLRGAPAQPGVNLLLYGPEGLDSHEVLHNLIRQSGREAYKLQTADSRKDRPTIAYVVQRLLALEAPCSMLVLDHPEQVLESDSGPLRAMFGLEPPAEISNLAERILSTNPTPTVWLSGPAGTLSDEVVGRFYFHAPLQRARKEDRRAHLVRRLETLNLSRATCDALIALEDVSALQVDTALRAVALSGRQKKAAREAALLQSVKRSLKAMARADTSKEKECVTGYSLDLLNCAGRFGPSQILKALSIRPKGTVCLYGPPGTGKTQFVEHLATRLGRRLIAKRASDLLSKWVGESEQNIAKMFTEAEAEEAILFLDEGDSFLRDRSLAQAGWEVSKVNELLQHMERFNGIFIVATNLFRGLDAAALRRFTFKLEFLPLTAEQRWEMFLQEAGIKESLARYPEATLEQWQEELTFLPQLTAGDFATVKRQCLLLDEHLSPHDWISQLKIECAAKAPAIAAA